MSANVAVGTDNKSVVNNNVEKFFVFNENNCSEKQLSTYQHKVSKYKRAKQSGNKSKIDYAYNDTKDWMMDCASPKPINECDVDNGDVVLEKVDETNSSLSMEELSEFHSLPNSLKTEG